LAALPGLVVGEASEVPTNRTPLRRGRGDLSHREWISLDYGEHGDRPAFGSDVERREAWDRHRERLLKACHLGRRPRAWWDYESPVRYPKNADYAVARLYEAGLLTDQELAVFTARWREEFEHAQDPNFEHCIGHAKPGDTFANWLSGAAARRAHYAWAGIPRELVKKWTSERRSRSKTIRRLRTAAERRGEPV
jgi:hypothetical protein